MKTANETATRQRLWLTLVVADLEKVPGRSSLSLLHLRLVRHFTTTHDRSRLTTHDLTTPRLSRLPPRSPPPSERKRLLDTPPSIHSSSRPHELLTRPHSQYQTPTLATGPNERQRWTRSTCLIGFHSETYRLKREFFGLVLVVRRIQSV